MSSFIWRVIFSILVFVSLICAHIHTYFSHLFSEDCCFIFLCTNFLLDTLQQYTYAYCINKVRFYWIVSVAVIGAFYFEELYKILHIYKYKICSFLNICILVIERKGYIRPILCCNILNILCDFSCRDIFVRFRFW